MNYMDKFMENVLSSKLWIVVMAIPLLATGLITNVQWVGLAMVIMGIGKVAEYKWGKNNGTKP